jgi:hypothetical protein
MKDEELVRLQIELEYRLTPQGRLSPLPDSSERSRFIVYGAAGGFIRFYREDLPDALRAALEAIPGSEALAGSREVQAVLSTHEPCGPVWTGRSHFFPKRSEAVCFENVVCDAGRFIIEEAGEVVSWAFSARENTVSAEAAVETLPAFRRRGFERATVSSWAASVMEAGKIAFFSHSHINAASAALATSLQVQQFAIAAAYD